MNLKITSQIPLSTGQTVTNAIAMLEPTLSQTPSGGLSGPCEITTYVSLALRTAGADKISPVIANTYTKITACSITLTPEQAAAAGLPYTIYQVVAAYLTATYGWTVTVEI